MKFGEHLDGRRTITETRALAIMIRTAASFYGTGERLMLVDWGETQSHIVRTGEALADEVIEAHVRGMSEFLGMQITVRREGKRYIFDCRSDKGTLHLVYDKSAHTSKDVGVN